MSIASKAACLLLAWLQLAAPALAQSAPPADARRELLRPPELATPPAAPPDYQLQPQGYPLSAQILQINLAPFEITRAGLAIPELVPAVAGSPRAETLIRQGEGQVQNGTVYGIAGLVLVVGSLIVGLVIVDSNEHLSDTQAGVVAGAIVGTLVGIVLGVIGGGLVTRGTRNIAQGVNAYNQDLLDGRLVAPAATAVPAR